LEYVNTIIDTKSKTEFRMNDDRRRHWLKQAVRAIIENAMDSPLSPPRGLAQHCSGRDLTIGRH